LSLINYSGPAIKVTGSHNVINNDVAHDNLFFVWFFGGTGNTASQNSVYNDGCDAIGLGAQCGPPLPEQECGGGTGPNNLTNAPVISDCTSSNGGTTCHAREDVPPGTSCTIEFFENDICGASGYGEGKKYIGSATCTSDTTCEARCTLITNALQPGQYCTATATDMNKNTSEFSACKTVISSGSQSNDCDFDQKSCSVDQGGGACVSNGGGANTVTVTPSAGTGTVSVTVSRTGNLSAAASVDYQTVDGTATQKKNYTIAFGTLKFVAGEASKTITVLLTNEDIVEGNQSFYLVLLNPKGMTLGDPSSMRMTIIDKDTSPPTSNPIDQTRLFVQQHYYDFLSRYPDSGGWDFWTNNISNCTPQPSCLDPQRISTSASFFLSIEFQQTGYLVERMYKTAFGDATGSSTFPSAHQLSVPIVRFNEFMADTQQIGQGLVVGQTGWETILENNKQNFSSQFVQRSRFTAVFPTTMTPTQFVDKLFLNAGVSPSVTDRTAAINEFGTATTTTDAAARGRALRRVAENATLNTQEFNRAFVLMQYFGYLRRDPNGGQDTDYSGYDFWLSKLNQFNGNFIDAEMVKAFLTSIEYRQRFGP
jgi:Calx-beta domain